MTLVIAHRGASWDERENTLAAFERAIVLGADYVELDVQASRDGELVVFHDLELDRLTPLTGPLRHRAAAELREVGIPTLGEVVELTRGRVGLMAEPKSAWRYRAQDLAGRTARLLAPDDVLVSFEPWALREALRTRPNVRAIQHVGYGVSIRRASGYAWAAGFHDRRATRRGIERARALGLATTVFTVNEPARMRELVALGVDGIFTDRPDVLRAALQ
jgi:glycerophosphoryl diester phosphodiesterase